MSNFDSAPGQVKEGRESAVEKYTKGFTDLAQLSRELEKGIYDAERTNGLPGFLAELRKRIKPDDLFTIKEIIKRIE